MRYYYSGTPEHAAAVEEHLAAIREAIATCDFGFECSSWSEHSPDKKVVLHIQVDKSCGCCGVKMSRTPKGHTVRASFCPKCSNKMWYDNLPEEERKRRWRERKRRQRQRQRRKSKKQAG